MPRDYYEVLGVGRDADRGGGEDRLPPARPRAAPRRQRPRPGGRGEVQGGGGSLRGALRPGAAPRLRRLRPRGAARQRLRAGRRLRLDRRHLPGLLRRPGDPLRGARADARPGPDPPGRDHGDRRDARGERQGPEPRGRARDRAALRHPARHPVRAARARPAGVERRPARRPGDRRPRDRPQRALRGAARSWPRKLGETLEPRNLRSARRRRRRASSPACGAPSVDPPRGPLPPRAGRAGPRRADRAGARTGSRRSAGPGYVEYAIYGGEGELPELGELEAAAGDGLVEVVSTEVPDDWADRWQDFHKPLLVGERLWLRPSWEEPREGAIDLVVDPGRAFGTGAHPTTRLCLELLLELAAGGRGRRPAHRPRHRLRRPRDRRRQARLGPGPRLRPRARRRSRRRPPTPRPTASTVELRAAQPAREPAGARADGRRQHDRARPAGGGSAAGGDWKGRGASPLLLRRTFPVPSTSSARACCPPSWTRSPPPSPAAGLAEADRRMDGDWAALAAPSPASGDMFPPMAGDDRRSGLQDRASSCTSSRSCSPSARPSATRSSSRSRSSSRAACRRSSPASSGRSLSGQPGHDRDPAGGHLPARSTATSGRQRRLRQRRLPRDHRPLRRSSTASSSRRCARRWSSPSAT